MTDEATPSAEPQQPTESTPLPDVAADCARAIDAALHERGLHALVIVTDGRSIGFHSTTLAPVAVLGVVFQLWALCKRLFSVAS